MSSLNIDQLGRVVQLVETPEDIRDSWQECDFCIYCNDGDEYVEGCLLSRFGPVGEDCGATEHFEIVEVSDAEE